jgi:hypothetical protein
MNVYEEAGEDDVVAGLELAIMLSWRLIRVIGINRPLLSRRLLYVGGGGASVTISGRCVSVILFCHCVTFSSIALSEVSVLSLVVGRKALLSPDGVGQFGYHGYGNLSSRMPTGLNIH